MSCCLCDSLQGNNLFTFFHMTKLKAGKTCVLQEIRSVCNEHLPLLELIQFASHNIYLASALVDQEEASTI